MNFNKVFLGGRITRDIQLRYTPANTAVADFGIAVNNKFKGKDGDDREEVCFVDVTAWGKQAELINQYFTKGKPIFIEGRLKYDTWEDKQGGGKRSKLTVTLEGFQFVGGRDGGGEDRGDGQNVDRSTDQTQRAPSKFNPRNRPAPGQRPPAEQPFGDEEAFTDTEIPF